MNNLTEGTDWDLSQIVFILKSKSETSIIKWILSRISLSDHKMNVPIRSPPV